MLNQVVLVGRLVAKPSLSEPNKKISTITLAIPRSFKNTEGEYETDFIECELWNTLAESTCEYCNKGDLVGVKGRLESYSVEQNDNIYWKTKVVAEKVTFLSSKKND